MPLSYNAMISSGVYGRFGVFDDTVNSIPAVSLFNGDVVMKNRLFINGQTQSVPETIPALTSNNTTITGNPSAWLNGDYIVSSSNNSISDFYAFDKVLTSYVELTGYGSSQIYTGSISTIVSGVTVSGAWIQIKTPYKSILTQYKLTTTSINNAPYRWVVAGSLNNKDFYLLDTQSNEIFTTNIKTYNIVNTTGYIFYRLIVEKAFSTTFQPVRIVDVDLVGTGQISITPPTNTTMYVNGNTNINGNLTVTNGILTLPANSISTSAINGYSAGVTLAQVQSNNNIWTNSNKFNNGIRFPTAVGYNDLIMDAYIASDDNQTLRIYGDLELSTASGGGSFIINGAFACVTNAYINGGLNLSQYLNFNGTINWDCIGGGLLVLTANNNGSYPLLTISGGLNVTNLTTFSGGAVYNSVLPSSSLLPTLATEFVTKGFCDANYTGGGGGGVTLAQIQSNNNVWTGTNVYNILPSTGVDPTLPGQLCRKGFCDATYALISSLSSYVTTATANATYATTSTLLNYNSPQTSKTDIIPTMTSNNTASPPETGRNLTVNGSSSVGLGNFIVNGSSMSGAGFEFYRAFDNNSNTYWGTTFTRNQNFDGSYSGGYTGINNIIANGITYYGEYITISLPKYFNANSATFSSPLILSVRVFGGLKTSSNATVSNWVLLNDTLGTTSILSNVNFTNNNYYNAYAFQVYNIAGNNNSLYLYSINYSGFYQPPPTYNSIVGVNTGCYLGCQSGGFVFSMPINFCIQNYDNLSGNGRDNWYIINAGYKIVVYSSYNSSGSPLLTIDNTNGNIPFYYNGAGTGAGVSCQIYQNNVLLCSPF